MYVVFTKQTKAHRTVLPTTNKTKPSCVVLASHSHSLTHTEKSSSSLPLPTDAEMKYLITEKTSGQNTVSFEHFSSFLHRTARMQPSTCALLANSHTKRQVRPNTHGVTVTYDASPRPIVEAFPTTNRQTANNVLYLVLEKFSILIVHLRLKPKEEEVD